MSGAGRGRFRFGIGHLMLLTAAVAGFAGMFAPELRSMDRDARMIFLLCGVVTAAAAVSFTPVWVAIFWFRRRSRAGRPFGWLDLPIVLGAFLLGLGILTGIGVAAKLILVG